MDSSQTWPYAPETTYSPAGTASVSSYFARPNKVVKSNSRNNSPRDLGRRRTTTAATISSRAKSVVDHLRSTAHGQQWQSPETSHSRPLSWHPASVQEHDFPFDPFVNDQDLSGWNFSTAQVNGLVTPISYPAVNEPHIEEIFTPLEELPAPRFAATYAPGPVYDWKWAAQDQAKAQSYKFDMFPQHSSFQPSWHPKQGPGSVEVQTAPSSPDFLQVPNIDIGTLSLDNGGETGDTGAAEELVGMGLYDSPAEVQSTSFLFGGISSGRKALKLEESFEPGEQEEGEEREAEDAQEQETLENDDATDDALEMCDNPDYASQSIASHLTFGAQPEVNPLAFNYLATLSQLNSAYYPTASHGYGWI